jgi:hypothetical protein
VTDFLKMFRHWNAGRSQVQIYEALNVDRIPPPLMLMDQRCRAAPVRTASLTTEAGIG